MGESSDGAIHQDDQIENGLQRSGRMFVFPPVRRKGLINKGADV